MKKTLALTSLLFLCTFLLSVEASFAFDSANISYIPANPLPVPTGNVIIGSGTGQFYCNPDNSSKNSYGKNPYPNGWANCVSPPISYAPCPNGTTPMAQIAFAGNDVCTSSGTVVQKIVISTTPSGQGNICLDSSPAYHVYFGSVSSHTSGFAYAYIQGNAYPNTKIWINYTLYCATCNGPNQPSCQTPPPCPDAYYSPVNCSF